MGKHKPYRQVQVHVIGWPDEPHQTLVADGRSYGPGEDATVDSVTAVHWWLDDLADITGVLGPDIPDELRRSYLDPSPSRRNITGGLLSAVDCAIRYASIGDARLGSAMAEMEREAQLALALLELHQPGAVQTVRDGMRIVRAIIQEHQEGKHRGQTPQ